MHSQVILHFSWLSNTAVDDPRDDLQASNNVFTAILQYDNE